MQRDDAYLLDMLQAAREAQSLSAGPDLGIVPAEQLNGLPLTSHHNPAGSRHNYLVARGRRQKKPGMLLLTLRTHRFVWYDDS